ncbi:MAG: zf-TFIIB domain-containing protein [Pseudomonadaceae bacterium]|nr:zf-TFIIB domain-containing protein [Pseudomonadaceae bacterium]
MDCPKCEGSLVNKTYGRKITVARCDGCSGLFCKPEVLMEMKEEWMSEILDMGDRKVGKSLDSVRDIQCPECAVAMNAEADPKQTHIWYEECPQCNGIFFDAGEFTDWKYDTFMDRLRDIFKGRAN